MAEDRDALFLFLVRICTVWPLQCQTRSPLTRIKGGDISASVSGRSPTAFVCLNSKYADTVLGWPFPPQGEDSSHSSPAPAWGPSHRRQFSTSCSNVSPSHGVPSFRNRLLQRGSLPWGAVLQEQAAPAWVPITLEGVKESEKWKKESPLVESQDSEQTHPLGILSERSLSAAGSTPSPRLGQRFMSKRL